VPYRSVFARSFKKEFRRLPKDIQERVIETLEKVADNPHSGTRLQGRLSGLWRCRLGKYRLVYLIEEKEHSVVFLDVGLRKSIYE
jgi:mRNA interferase RelE/StbE